MKYITVINVSVYSKMSLLMSVCIGTNSGWVSEINFKMKLLNVLTSDHRMKLFKKLFKR